MVAAGAASLPHNDPDQDALRLEPERALYIVSDGVGSYPGADVASRTVVEVAGDALVGDWPPPGFERRRWLSRAVATAANALHEAGQADPALKDMTATLTLLALRSDEYALVHIGDSRAYRLRDRKLEQLTRDHSVGWEQYELGVLTKDALRTNPNQKLLTRAISAREAFAVPELFDGDVQPNDVFLLCSDGLTKALTDEEIRRALRANQAAGPQPAADALIAAARAAATDDDCTVVVVQT